MSPPEPPRRHPLGRVAAEPNVSRAPHTPVPPPLPLRDAVSTAPPPAMPMAPPRGMQGPRTHQRQQPERAESTLVGLAPPVARDEVAKAEAEELRRQLRALDTAHRAPSSRPPKRADWAKLLFGLGGALTLFLGAAGTYLGARAASNEGKVDNVAAAASAQKVVVDPLPGQVAHVERGTDSCREWARLYADYDRQVFRKLGVIIPEPENAPPVEPIKTRAPVRRANAVTGAPQLEVLTPPPALP